MPNSPAGRPSGFSRMSYGRTTIEHFQLPSISVSDETVRRSALLRRPGSASRSSIHSQRPERRSLHIDVPPFAQPCRRSLRQGKFSTRSAGFDPVPAIEPEFADRRRIHPFPITRSPRASEEDRASPATGFSMARRCRHSPKRLPAPNHRKGAETIRWRRIPRDATRNRGDPPSPKRAIALRGSTSCSPETQSRQGTVPVSTDIMVRRSAGEIKMECPQLIHTFSTARCE